MPWPPKPDARLPAECRGGGSMPRPYSQLILVNMFLAFLFTTTLFGAPPLSALVGVLGAGVLLYLRRQRREHYRSAAAASEPSPRRGATPGAAARARGFAPRTHRRPT